jgi:hypothetical protein
MTEAVQQSKVTYETEIRQLHETISISREKLDALKFTSDNHLHQQTSRNRDEVDQLHKTIQALRDKFERSQKQGGTA